MDKFLGARPHEPRGLPFSQTPDSCPGMRSIANLQIVRGIAAASVVYFHINVSPVFGSFGVDIFFVLSGFVMAMIVEAGQAPRDFIASRLARIVPLYWLLTLGLFVVAQLSPGLLNSATADLSQLLKSLLFIPFFRANGDMYPLLGVGWTLNYEMLFYGCILCGMLSFRSAWSFVTASLLVALHLVLGHLAGNRLTEVFFGSSLLWEFLYGIFAFMIFKRGVLNRVSVGLAVVAALLGYGAMAVFESNGITTIRALVFGLPSLLMILAALRLEAVGQEKPGRLKWVLVKVGDASYATYLSHYFVVMGIERVFAGRLVLFNPRSPAGIFAVLLAALVAGQLLYEYVDRPMHSFFKQRWVRSRATGHVVSG